SGRHYNIKSKETFINHTIDGSFTQLISQLLLVLLLLCYVNLSKNSFSVAQEKRCSQKRVQRYGLFQYTPNILKEKC
ncbi:hypothetical protein, partial [Prevotella sp. P2-180]|uniref:hypothetical protein n=1 Tax=Prevotella sp. P2-180 TaxID=2024224 RepID=UPI001C0ECB35